MSQRSQVANSAAMATIENASLGPWPDLGKPSGISCRAPIAVQDVSPLVRYEINLAKIELKGDAQRVGIAVVLVGMAGFVSCPVLVMLSWALGYGLITLGTWTWAAFLIVAGVWALVGVIAIGIAYLRIRHLSGLRETRKTVSEGIGIMRPEVPFPRRPAPGDRRARDPVR